MFNLDGIVVLYNPDTSVIENIKSYINNVNRLFVVDNSDKKNRELNDILNKFSNIEYICNNGNQGIANALNVGAKRAIENGADWLLTMDQDSKFEDDSLSVLAEWIDNHDTSKIGIISPFHLTKNLNFKKEDEVVDKLTVMTSGNLLNLKAYQDVGVFEEKYFIDYVDHEYCLRLQKNGYNVKVHKNSVLVHALGDISSKSIFGKKIIYTNHNYVRRYYITRNRLDVIRKYFFKYFIFSFKEIKAIVFEWIKIVLFEQNKIKKQKSIFMGIFDFLRNKYGKYDV